MKTLNDGWLFKNKQVFYRPLLINAMIVNTELANGMKIDGFEDLLNPALQGKIAFAILQ